MVKYIKGNIFDSPCKALVCPVNTQGVMGAGLAKQFKERFPCMFAAYKEGCDHGWLFPGGVHVYWGDQPIDQCNKVIINLATKDHWKNPSRIKWIKEGLANLSDRMEFFGIHSVAIPPIGCGLGGLDWNKVKALIEEEFRELPDITVEIYEPL